MRKYCSYAVKEMKEHRKYIQDYLINVFTLRCPTFYSVVSFKAQKTF